jgi:serine phosphatase RsbU (regulator of sigma subunit)
VDADRRTSQRGVLACLGLCLAVVAADLAHGPEKTQYVGLLVAVPFLAATFGSATHVLLLGAGALLAGALIGEASLDGRGTPQFVRLACIALAAVLAALAARSRVRREARLVQVQDVADAASRAILRPLPPVLAGVPVSVRYLSASEGARVGGDLYEAVDTPYGLRMVVGDVRGKGLDAVRLASLTLGSFREAAHREPDLQQVAEAMHVTVTRDAGPEDFVTAVLVEVVGDRVRMLSCGHPPPYAVRAGVARELRLPEATPLGIAPPPAAVDVDVRAGDRVLLYTDGAAEARRKGSFFALADCAARVLTAHDLPRALEVLGTEVHAYGDGPADDIAFLAFELPGRDVLVPAPR